jgi:lipoprotein-anchoring transpeptidase ErfK/SrfK
MRVDNNLSRGALNRLFPIMINISTAQNKLSQVRGSIPDKWLLVDTAAQKLYRLEKGGISREYPVSTSKFGIGNAEGSFKTPQGVHEVKEKYGNGAPSGRVFRDRIDTGEEWPAGAPGENLILSRILRLAGLEDGINRGPGIDSYERYIYIHGTGNEAGIGSPASHGCICMKNKDIIELFDTIPEGAIVYID